ncbi:MAG: hypothetical protein ACYDB6_08575, partial [Candidatus Limnocylindrales bacterium]
EELGDARVIDEVASVHRSDASGADEGDPHPISPPRTRILPPRTRIPSDRIVALRVRLGCLT